MQVTIWGQSAGAGSVRVLLGSPKAQGLFGAAIASSNLGGYNYATTYSEYLSVRDEYSTAALPVLQATRCNSSSVAQEASCVSKVDPETLANVSPAQCELNPL
jgi:carboxylesterase type B